MRERKKEQNAQRTQGKREREGESERGTKRRKNNERKRGKVDDNKSEKRGMGRGTKRFGEKTQKLATPQSQPEHSLSEQRKHFRVGNQVVRPRL